MPGGRAGAVERLAIRPDRFVDPALPAVGLGELGAHVIDADKLGHRAYLAGTAAFDQVVATFGTDVVGEDGEIDRRALGAKVFGEGSRLDELTGNAAINGVPVRISV